MRVRRRAIAALAVLVLAGCNSGTDVDTADEAPADEAAATEYTLPFGLTQTQGTVAVAPPVLAEQLTGTYDGEPIHATSLRAAYRVTGSPHEVMAAWSEQFAGLGIGEVMVSTASPDTSDAPEQWMQLSAYSSGVSMSYANAELWATSGEPLLLVEVDLSPELVPVAVEPPVLPELPEPPLPMPEALVGPGEELLGIGVHLPSGVEQAMPNVPSISGTAGEVVMLTTDDPLATVSALVQEAYDHNEALPQHETGSIDGPHQAELDGSTTVTARFDSGSGGWGFTALASQGPGGGPASVWIRTGAD